MKSYEDFKALNEGRYGGHGTIWLLFTPDGTCYASFEDLEVAARWVESLSADEPGWTLVAMDVKRAARHVTESGLRRMFEEGYVTAKDGWVYFTSIKHRMIPKGR
jgi:hypothetical protein